MHQEMIKNAGSANNGADGTRDHPSQREREEPAEYSKVCRVPLYTVSKAHSEQLLHTFTKELHN